MSVEAHTKGEERRRRGEGERYDRVRLGMGTNGCRRVQRVPSNEDNKVRHH
jgi:hypothetical protein